MKRESTSVVSQWLEGSDQDMMVAPVDDAQAWQHGGAGCLLDELLRLQEGEVFK